MLKTVRFRPAFFLALAVLLLMAWSDRFVQDQAFVSFEYARNLAEGRGLVWSTAQPAGAPPSLAWALLMAAGIGLGADPVEFSMAAGVVCLLAVLWVTWHLAMRTLGSRGQALLALIVIGTNYSFSAWSTGGQETILQTLAAVAMIGAAGAIIDSGWPPRPSSLAGASAVMGLGLLARADSAVFAGLAGLALAAWLWRRSPTRGGRHALVWLCVPFLAIAGGWLAWRRAYGGAMIPAVHGWAGFGDTLGHGVFYLYSFFLSYWLVWVPFLLLPALPRLFAARASLRLTAAAAVLWPAFLIGSGGDTMEYRRMLPAFPFLVILILWVLFQYVEQRSIRHALLLLIFAGSVHHALTFHGEGGAERRDIESVNELAARISPGDGDWVNIGRRLGHIFSRRPVVIATSSGAVAYYSRLETVAMDWGSSELDALRERGVNLVLGEPTLVGRDQRPGRAGTDFAHFMIYEPMLKSPPPGIRLVYIPMGGEHYLEALYLVPSPVVDEAIEAGGWVAAPLPPGVI